jgi:50S ribosomal protein L16 3-hydroxylase
MLYLPPGVPHHGVAEDACLTFSVGMRAPSAAELLGDFVDTLAADADESLRYRDPDLAPAKDPTEIDAGAMGRVVEALNMLRMNDPDRVADWFGRFITTYRSSGIVAAPDADLSPGAVSRTLDDGGRLLRNPFSRMAWSRTGRGARLYVAGRSFELSVGDARRIAHADTIDPAAWAALGEAGRAVVAELAAGGHYHLDDGAEE